MDKKGAPPPEWTPPNPESGDCSVPEWQEEIPPRGRKRNIVITGGPFGPQLMMFYSPDDGDIPRDPNP